MSLFTPKPEVGLDSLRQVVGLIKKAFSKLGGVSGVTSAASDPTCDRLAALDIIPTIFVGVVVRSGFGSYDCEVATANGNIVVCGGIAPLVHDTYGVSQSCMPVPGSHVLVYAPLAGLSRQSVMRGFILGVVPDNGTGGVSARGESVIDKLADSETDEGGASQLTEAGPRAVATDKDYPYRGEFQCGRPHDIVPGEYGLINHAGAGLHIGALSTTIRGSELASVRCSALDDQVRVTSGHFRHISSAGSEEIYNDGGFITVEASVSMYHGERLGVVATGKGAFTWEGGTAESLAELSSGVVQRKPTQTAKKRFYRYAGYLGDIVNVFVANPDPSKEVEDMDSKSRDQGLFHQHLDASGRFTMRSAAGILLERYDRIPVPKRRHYAWDPKGTDGRSVKSTKKDWYDHDKNHPHGIGLTLGDRAAWWDSLAYQRFREFREDFDVQEQKDLKCPDNAYDTPGKGTEDIQEFDTRHSYIGLTPDGGIVLRDAWGSEIVMADGRITLNAAANIEIRSGSSVVILGGDDIVAKAYNSVDIGATKKDIRLKAEGNMQVVSVKKGVLIQSKAKSDVPPDLSAVGEDLESSGVVIKADSSSVALVGRKSVVHGEEGVGIASFDKNGKPRGTVEVVGGSVDIAAKYNVVATADGTSGIVVSGQSAVVCAPSILVAGGNSVSEAAGKNFMLGVPIEFEDLYTPTIRICKSKAQLLLDKAEWLAPYEPKVIAQIDFRYRTTEQYGTQTDSGVSGGEFHVYQPSWVCLADRRPWMKSCKTKSWGADEVDAGGGMPWPGKEAMGGGAYVTFQEKNIQEKGIEDAKSREAVLTPTGFSSYHIRDVK